MLLIGISRGYSRQNCTWMCLLNLNNLTFSIPFFSPNYPPISIPFPIEKHTILQNWVLFNIIYSKHNLGSYVCDKKPPIATPNFVKEHPKRQAYNRYTISMWEPSILQKIFIITIHKYTCFNISQRYEICIHYRDLLTFL